MEQVAHSLTSQRLCDWRAGQRPSIAGGADPSTDGLFNVCAPRKREFLAMLAQRNSRVSANGLLNRRDHKAMSAPPAGITYGGHGIWSWELSPAEPLNHPGTGLARPWFEALRMPGSTDMKFLKNLFVSLKWWTLRPAPELLLEQPGETDPSRFVAAARAEEGTWALLYTPVGQEIKLRAAEIGKNLVVRWFNPRTGSWGSPEALAGPSDVLNPPDQEDWLVWIGPRGERSTRRDDSRAGHRTKSGL